MVKPHTSDSHTPTTLRKYHRTASAAAAVPPTSSTFLLHSMGNAFWQVFPSIDWWTKPIFHWNQTPNLESNRMLNLNPNNSMSSGGLMVAVSKLLKLKLWKEVMAAHTHGFVLPCKHQTWTKFNLNPKQTCFRCRQKFPTNKLWNDMVQFGFHKIHGQDSTVIHTKRPHCIYNKQNHITKKLCTFDMFCRTCRFSLLNVQKNFIVKRQFGCTNKM